MGFGEGTCNGGGTECSKGVQCVKTEAVDNGFEVGIVIDGCEGSSGGSEGFRTYKRRKRTRSSLDNKGQVEGRASVDAPCNLPDQKHWRDVVLEHLCQSLSEGEGIQRCIRDALVFHPEIEHTTTVKGSVCCDKDNGECPSTTGGIPHGSKNAANWHATVMSNGSLNESVYHTNTHMCQRAFFNIIVSEKFTSLCKLLLENFQGMKVDGFFDFSLINSRMIEGAYERSPILFCSDIQLVWRKLQGIGTEMISIAKSLSDMSRTSFHEQGGLSVHSPSQEGKHEEVNFHAKPEQIEPACVLKSFSCRQCGNKADERECLVVDSCEELYHVDCIEPAVKEIPPRNLYCVSCTASGYGSLHENCVVCERLTAPRCLSNGTEEVTHVNEETVDNIEEKSNSSGEDGHEQDLKLHLCKICHVEVKNGDKFMICGHPFCPNKYYHVRCLTTRQLKSYGTRWYCPSCLCRTCLTDQDDNKIVLCDGCDHAYHIYCMNPPRDSIPKGKWFCRKCDAGIKEILKAKRAYEDHKNRQKKKGEGGKRAFANTVKIKEEKVEDESDKGRAGMYMLLTAANTLNYEEKLASIQMTS